MVSSQKRLNETDPLSAKTDGPGYVDAHDIGLDATKPVFGVSDKARLKPVS